MVQNQTGAESLCLLQGPGAQHHLPLHPENSARGREKLPEGHGGLVGHPWALAFLAVISEGSASVLGPPCEACSAGSWEKSGPQWDERPQPLMDSKIQALDQKKDKGLEASL